MKCHETKRRLDLFMDGELSVPDNLEVLEHLNLCRGCAGVYEGEKSLRTALREGPGAVRAPAGLADRVFARPTRPRAEHAPRPWGGSLAAAAFFVLFVGGLVFSPLGETPEAVASEVSRRHDDSRAGYAHAHEHDRRCLCPGCCAEADLEQAALRFFGRDDVCLHQEELKALGYRFYGVELWPHRGTTVPWMVYRDAKGRAITHALLATPVDPGAGSPVTAGDRSVLFVRTARNRTCVFIFDVHEEAERFQALMGGR